jgi:hypothetical protein
MRCKCSHNNGIADNAQSSGTEITTESKRVAFFDLPPELRCMIYSHAMESYTGCLIFRSTNCYYLREMSRKEGKLPVLECDMEYSLRTFEHIRPDASPPALNLSILATCKQIYEECRPYLWKNNAFLLNQHKEKLPQLIDSKSCASYLLLDVEHIVLGVQMICNFRLEEEFKSFEFLDQLSRRAKLKKITFFTPSWDNMESYCATWKTGFGNYMEMLDEATKGPLATLERKMILCSGYKELTWKGRQSRITNLPKNPTEVMDDLHSSFGGELWIDGVLCYKDGNRLQEPFKL